ncbi:MAG: biotin-dependent carboxyltransferase family protein, partial [Dehalococcoidia bacterium]
GWGCWGGGALLKYLIEVIEPGLLTTVQDTGRRGYARYGVPTSGAMDTFALRVANILVGTPEGEACLEITVTGPRLRFLSDALVALTGADLAPRLDGEPMRMWEAVTVRSGSTLSFEGPREGSRTYLALAGGIDVPRVMGSKSTYLKAQLGGLEGRALKSGDRLGAPLPSPPHELEGRRAPRDLTPTYGHQHLIRVITGPQDDAFTKKGLKTFLRSVYTITPQSDRMGYRLEGPKIQHKESPDIISDGIPLGGIQVAGDGMPIVLMADRGTSGGYTKIATVISVDVDVLAQSMPGDEVRFEAVGIEQAHEALRQQEQVISRLKAMVGSPRATRKFKMRLDGVAYDISVELAQDEPVGGKQGPRASGRVSLKGEEDETYTYQVDAESVEEE